MSNNQSQVWVDCSSIVFKAKCTRYISHEWRQKCQNVISNQPQQQPHNSAPTPSWYPTDDFTVGDYDST